MKAIVLAGGHGSRLLPLTESTNKTMIKIDGKPIIDYILNSIQSCGITDITIVANKFIDDIRNHVGGVAKFVHEDIPKGVGNALGLARDGNEGAEILIWFADNLTNLNLRLEVENFDSGCVLLAREVSEPSAFGVVKYLEGKIVDIIEKPENPPSNIAIGGIYIFDMRFWEIYDSVYPNSDFSISDITREYVKTGSAKTVTIGSNSWIDCGTHDGLKTANDLVNEGIIRFGDY